MTGRPAPPARTPHANARKLYAHVERYLVGALNEEALEQWRLAVAGAIRDGLALDAALEAFCRAYLTAVADRKMGRGA